MRAVLLQGLLGWGIPFTLIMAWLRRADDVALLDAFIFRLPFGLAGGAAFGVAMWWFAKRQTLKNADGSNRTEPKL
ncbi:MAG: hypothetical protein AAFV51_13945 [Pseudomonadota bacterium]